jgi:hypothetical protein
MQQMLSQRTLANLMALSMHRTCGNINRRQIVVISDTHRDVDQVPAPPALGLEVRPTGVRVRLRA